MTTCGRTAVLLAFLGVFIACERTDDGQAGEVTGGSIASDLAAAQTALFEALRHRDRDRLSAYLDPTFRWAYIQPDSTERRQADNHLVRGSHERRVPASVHPG